MIRFAHLDSGIPERAAAMHGGRHPALLSVAAAANMPPCPQSMLLKSLSDQLARAERAVDEQRFKELQRISHRLKRTLTLRGLDAMAHQAHKLEMAACCQESLLMQRALRRLAKSYEWLSEACRKESSNSISYPSGSSRKAIQPDPV